MNEIGSSMAGTDFDENRYVASPENNPTRVEALNSTYIYEGKLTAESMELNAATGKTEYARWIDGAVRVATISNLARKEMQERWEQISHRHTKLGLGFLGTSLVSVIGFIVSSANTTSPMLNGALVVTAIGALAFASRQFYLSNNALAERDRWNDPFSQYQAQRRECDPIRGGFNYLKDNHLKDKVITKNEAANIWFEEMEHQVKKYRAITLDSTNPALAKEAQIKFVEKFYEKDLLSRVAMITAFDQAEVCRNPKPGSNKEMTRDLAKILIARFKVQEDLQKYELGEINKRRETFLKLESEALLANEREKTKHLSPTVAFLEALYAQFEAEKEKKLLPYVTKRDQEMQEMENKFHLAWGKELSREAQDELRGLLDYVAKEHDENPEVKAIIAEYETKKNAYRALDQQMVESITKNFAERAERIRKETQDQLSLLKIEEENILVSHFSKIGKLIDSYDYANGFYYNVILPLPSAPSFEEAHQASG